MKLYNCLFFKKILACRSGGIGRRKGLKIPRGIAPCRFKSGLRHHYTDSFINLCCCDLQSDNPDNLFIARQPFSGLDQPVLTKSAVLLSSRNLFQFIWLCLGQNGLTKLLGGSKQFK